MFKDRKRGSILLSTGTRWSDNSSDLTPAREAVMERYYDALVDAIADQRRFTVSELDELLATA